MPKRARRRLAVLAAGLGLLVAACGSVQFSVQKQVTDDLTQKGPFTVSIACTAGPPDSDTLEFNNIDANGQETLLSVTFDDDAVCEITETVNGGAIATTIACGTPLPADITCGPPGTTLTVNGNSVEDDVVVPIIVTNEFPTVPDPPIHVVASLGSIIVTWTAPADDGGSPITGYIIRESPTGARFETDAATTSITIPCPEPGTYSYHVRAVNALGRSEASAESNQVTVTSEDPECVEVVPVAPLVLTPTFTG